MTSSTKIFDQMLSYDAIDDKSVFLLIAQIKEGISFSIFNKLTKEIPFSLSDWSRFLHLSERTLQRHKKDEKSFDPIYSEKILEVSMLYNLGVAVFGDKDSFAQWLSLDNVALGAVSPMSLLDSNLGIALIKDELTRIEHGILA